MKKASLFGMVLVGAVALLAGCANDEAVTATDSASCSSEKACSAEASACQDKAAKTGCCSKDKAAGATN